MKDFPHWLDAPTEFREPTACGLLAAWQVLTHFGIQPVPDDLSRRCRFDPQVGVYSVGLALGLAEFGLTVQWYSDVDPTPAPLERELYELGAERGIAPSPAPVLTSLLDTLAPERVGVLLYQVSSDIAHFTPVLGRIGTSVIAPNEGDTLSVAELEARWNSPHIYRQCVIGSLSRVA